MPKRDLVAIKSRLQSKLIDWKQRRQVSREGLQEKKKYVKELILCARLICMQLLCDKYIIHSFCK